MPVIIIFANNYKIEYSESFAEQCMEQCTRFKIGSKVRKCNGIECGFGNPVRIVANIGITFDTDIVEEEVMKAQAAHKAGADIVTDHSVAANISDIHRQLLENVTCPISTVSIYQAYAEAQRENSGPFRPRRAIETFEKQACLGLDLLTVHATILKADLPMVARSKRLIPATSRGGMMVADLMMKSGIENPYWTYFKDIVHIAKSFGTALSLGTAFRPGSVVDTPDELYRQELLRMARLVEIATHNNVGIMVEGIGHARLDMIPQLVQEAKAVCHGVPYRVLCVACDSAIYRDHIASAIASAIATASGADIISAVSRSEHVKRPDVSDVVEAVETAKIAAHCGDIVRSNDVYLDERISKARGQMSCLAAGVSAILPRGEETSNRPCTMCGLYCALRIMRQIVKKYSKED